MPERTQLEPVKLETLPDDSWVQLRAENLQTPYHQIISGDFSVDVLEKFCAAIRAALDEYSADTRRVPGRNDQAASQLIQATKQVIIVATKHRRKLDDPASKVDEVIDAIKTHAESFTKALKESIAAAKKVSGSLVA